MSAFGMTGLVGGDSGPHMPTVHGRQIRVAVGAYTQRRQERIAAPDGRVTADRQYTWATLEQIGEEMGLSRERVRQIERRALFKLRKHIRIHGLDFEMEFGPLPTEGEWKDEERRRAHEKFKAKWGREPGYSNWREDE